MSSYPNNPNRYPGTRNAYPVSPKAYPATPNSYPTGFDYPATLTGVVLWLDARQAKYTDLAGTSPAGYGAPVRRVDLRVPAGQYASAASDSARPLQENGAVNFHPKDAIAAPASGTVPANNMTYALSYSLRDAWYGTALRNMGNAVGLGLNFFVNGPLPPFDFISDFAGNGFLSPAHLVPPGAPVVVVVRNFTTEVKLSAVIDGVRADFTLTRSNPATAITGPWQIAGQETLIAVNQTIIASRAISDTETTALLSWMSSVPAPNKFPTDTDFVGIHGDSIARSLNVTSRLDWWTTIMLESLCATRNINMYSSAWSGDTIGFQRTLYPTTMLPFYSSSRAKNVIVDAVGINNMRSLGQNAATAGGEYFSFLDLQLSDGFRPVACTVLPTTAVSAAITDAFNALVRANWASKGYAALADVAADPGLDDPNDVAIYPDGLHPSAAGNAIMAPIYAAAVAIART